MTGSKSGSDPTVGLDAAAQLRVRIGGLIAALLVMVAVAIAGSAIRQPLFDFFQRISPTPPVSSRIHVVLIDAPSLAALGGWPWSRYTLARLTENIGDRGAAAIGYDFLFPEPDKQSPDLFVDLYRADLSAAAASEVMGLRSMDGLFSRVIGRYNVVLGRVGVSAGSPDAADDPLPPEARFTGPEPRSIPAYPEIVGNIPIIDGAGLGHGLVNGPPDADGVIRRVPLLARAAGHLTPSFSLELARTALGEETIRLEGDADRLEGVRLGGRFIPTDDHGRLALRFRDLPDSAFTSAVDVLRKGLPADAFKDKVVLVGLTAAGTSDVVTTPRETETFGVLVQAQAVDALLAGQAMHRPAWAPWLEVGAGLLLVLAVWFFTPRLELATIGLVAVGSIVAAFATAWFAFQNGLLLDPTPALAPGAVANAVVLALLVVEGRRVQADMGAAIERQRLASAKIEGELSAASAIQTGMLIPREALGAVAPAVDVDAVLEPALTIGGDLYDAFPAADGRLCFLVGDVTGKGVPAALFMALAKSLTRSNLTRPGVALDAAVAAINTELSRDNTQSMALSLLVGLLDPLTGDLELCCAGHENPLVAETDGQAHEIRLEGGPPLCVVDDFPYPVERVRLAPGQTLIVYTDGLTEAQSPAGDLFGRDGVLRSLRYIGPQADLRRMTDGLIGAARAFEAGGEPSDDLTLLTLRLRAPN